VTEDQIAAVIASPLCILWGACFIIFRERISEAAQRQMHDRGHHSSAATQTPFVMALGGALFVVVGIALPFLVFTGFFDRV
jgi:hypothetical protein